MNCKDPECRSRKAKAERERRKRIQERINADPVFAVEFRAKAKVYRDRHYKTHYIHRRWKFCVRCGNKSMNDLCGRCRAKEEKKNNRVGKIAVLCSCGKTFAGYRREKYCQACRVNDPSLKLAVQCSNERLRSKLAGLPADFKPRDWRRAKQHFNNHCAYCGRDGELHQDHFIPLALGGAYTRNNIVPVCPSCNNDKSDKHPATWLPVEKYQEIQAYLKGFPQ